VGKPKRQPVLPQLFRAQIDFEGPESTVPLTVSIALPPLKGSWIVAPNATVSSDYGQQLLNSMISNTWLATSM
jgi:hypothetical protein